MSEQDKRCGTCKWWLFLAKNTDGRVTRWAATGTCKAPIPDAVMGDWGKDVMRDTSGRQCDAWQPKERLDD